MSSDYEQVKAWRKRNPEKRAEQERRRYKKHKKEIDIYRANWRSKNLARLKLVEAERARIWRKNNPEAQKIRNQRHKEKREAERVAIAGRPRPDYCELCGELGEPASSVYIYRTLFDHDHITGKFRGWICDRCNKVLGLVEDNPDLLKEMIKYLGK